MNIASYYLQATGWDVAHGGLHVVGDPFHKVGAVLVLDVEHLLVDFLHGHATTEHGSHCEVAAVTRIAGSHHVLGIEHLLGELGDCQSSDRNMYSRSVKKQRFHGDLAGTAEIYFWEVKDDEAFEIIILTKLCNPRQIQT